MDIIGQPLGQLGTLAVEFDWPFEVANGKWLLYLTKIVVSGQSKTECTPPEVINPLNVSSISELCFNYMLNYNYCASYDQPKLTGKTVLQSQLLIKL